MDFNGGIGMLPIQLFMKIIQEKELINYLGSSTKLKPIQQVEG